MIGTALTASFVILLSVSFGNHCNDGIIRGVQASSATSATGSCTGIGGGSTSACCGQSCKRHPSLFPSRGGGGQNEECQQDSSESAVGVSLFHRPPPFDKPSVLLLDVDNTLYSEAALQESGMLGIEEQVVRNIHNYALRRFNLTTEESDQLHNKYGSTIEGIRRTLLSNTTSTHEIMQQFYHEVYHDVDVSPLLALSVGNGGRDVNTGYSSSSNLHWPNLRQALNTLPCPLYFVSNSPYRHVMKVLTALGLRNVPFEAILTPDSPLVRDPQDENAHPFPTKSNPDIFYRAILERYPTSEHQWILLDDSLYNLRRAASVLGIRTAHISPDNRMTLQQGLGYALGHTSSTNYDAQGNVVRSLGYSFDEVQYLRSKNVVDFDSINPSVWKRLIEEMSLSPAPKAMKIVDLGAGLFSMLKLMVFGHRKDSGNLAPFFQEIANRMEKESSWVLDQVIYEAYESNTQLLEGATEVLVNVLGFDRKSHSSEEHIFGGNIKVTTTKGKSRWIKIQVHLRLRDYRAESSSVDDPPELIVGSCFADLVDPRYLVPSLLRFTQLLQPSASSAGPLVYFPITFAGTTSFVPAQPFMSAGGVVGSIPSDTAAFRMYASSLVRKGHSIDPQRLVTAMNDVGAVLLCRDASDWFIDPSLGDDQSLHYLWNTMLYFFGSQGGMEMMMSKETTGQQWDVAAWVERARKMKPAIRVSNVDLLFRLPSLDRDVSMEESASPRDIAREEAPSSREFISVEEIQFVAPKRVGKIQKEWNVATGSHLGPLQVEIRAVCSLISSGTELKIFNGMFEEAALDVNIKSMAEESMKYPLAYGYSLVGTVTRCGSEVPDASNLLGRLVFAFSPHASHAVVDRDSIQIVPEGIAAEDAIFMPSMETALSLVHDANVRVGERVAVYGQGLIGLLVTSILCHSGLADFGTFGSVTVFDLWSERLSAASDMGASAALPPSEAAAAGPFDVSMEVSGNGRALQSAMDHTADGGRVIVGSWYGNQDVKLKLGINFHRSHKVIQTSQVSTIPAKLSGLWTKGRRFALTWQLVRMLRPSRLVSRYVTLEEAQEAYELLDAGKVISIAFRY